MRYAASRIELDGVKRRIGGILDGIERGIVTERARERLLGPGARKKELETMAPPPPLPRLHPRLPEVYRKKVERLHEALDRDDTRAEAAEMLRMLIEEVRLHPDAAGGMRAELHGELGTILALCEGREQNGKLPGTGVPGSQLSVVAGARNHLYRTDSRWTGRSQKR